MMDGEQHRVFSFGKVLAVVRNELFPNWKVFSLQWLTHSIKRECDTMCYLWYHIYTRDKRSQALSFVPLHY